MRKAPYLFIAPFLIVFAAFGAYPLAYAFQLSFTRWHGAGQARWVGLDNYLFLLTNPEFWESLANSAVMWLLVVPVQIVAGLAAAVLLANARLKLKSFFRVAFIAPFVTPLVAMAQVWIVIFDQDYGLVNYVLNADIGWLTSTTWSKPTLALLFLWKTTGFAIIILLAGLQAVPAQVYEAAALDGASRSRQFWSITMPLVRRSIAFLVVIQTLAVFQMFAEPFVVTEGGPYGSTTTAGLYLYDHILASDLGTGAANSFLLVLLVFVLSVVSVRLLRAKDE
ncbi:carbohydrate ABC transporter permease [Nonomuraea soli]|uniref:ABC-type sugar transport system permease subunit n=1 Tax=Nonomuraea soli TaxID=1032476 RepID=A0A7W0HVF2_9ACTN|nr:sugar ABC transporter permease [Nonomuraea soli]MBA2897100.1 ABC-type sugar transport system permease subunit [Nonomuraea soli]